MRGVAYSSMGLVTVRLIDRQRRRRTIAAERDSMTREAVLLDVFGTLLDDEADTMSPVLPFDVRHAGFVSSTLDCRPVVGNNLG